MVLSGIKITFAPFKITTTQQKWLQKQLKQH